MEKIWAKKFGHKRIPNALSLDIGVHRKVPGDLHERLVQTFEEEARSAQKNVTRKQGRKTHKHIRHRLTDLTYIRDGDTKCVREVLDLTQRRYERDGSQKKMTGRKRSRVVEEKGSSSNDRECQFRFPGGLQAAGSSKMPTEMPDVKMMEADYADPLLYIPPRGAKVSQRSIQTVLRDASAREQLEGLQRRVNRGALARRNKSRKQSSYER